MTDTEIEVYQKALAEARQSFTRNRRRLTEISIEEFELNTDQVRLRRTVTALAAMCSESPWSDPLGITDSCAEIMEIEKTEVTTQEVMKRMEAIGFDLSSQKNPAASVHSVLTRLAAKGKISKINKDDEEVAWRGPRYVDLGDEFVQSAEISDDDIPF
jgi:hypothetical protein